MAVLNTANRIYSSGKLVYRIFLNTVLVYIDNFQVFKKRVLDDGGIFKETPIVFNNEKLLLTPNAYKTGKIYSALPHDGSGDFTFSRNSSATYIEDGIIKTAQPNVPRFQDGKILIEEQSTNIITYSTRITPTLVILTTVSITTPLGSSAELINEGTDTNRHRAYQPLPVIEGKTYTYTFILKKSMDDWCQILLQSDRFSGDSWGNFNLKTGSIGQTGILNNSEIKHIGDGWFVCSVTGTAISSGVSYSMVLTTNNTDSGRYPSYQGDNRDNFYFLASQLEEGSKATSYIPTDGTVVTRLADIATVTPPTGATEIIETIDGVDNTRTTIPATYQLPVGEINKVIMQ